MAYAMSLPLDEMQEAASLPLVVLKGWTTFANQSQTLKPPPMFRSLSQFLFLGPTLAQQKNKRR